MSDSISKQDAIDAIVAWTVEDRPDIEMPTDLVDRVNALPSAEHTGKWIQISPAKIYECSVCGQNVMTDDIDCYKYCHGCGARMVSE